MQGHVEHSPDSSLHASDNAHVNQNITRLDLGLSTILAVSVFALLVGVCGVIIGMDIAERASMQRDYDSQAARMRTVIEDDQRAYRMAELKYDELNLTLRRAGLALPGDYRQGVGGNLDSEAFAPPQVNEHGRHSLHHPAQRNPQVPDGPH